MTTTSRGWAALLVGVFVGATVPACATVIGLERGELAAEASADGGSPSADGGSPVTNEGGDVPGEDYASRVLRDEPLAYYPFEEAAGAATIRNRATGSQPRDRDGAVVGATLGFVGARGGADAAMVAEGVEARVDLTWSGIPNGNEPFSIELVVRPEQIEASPRVLLSHRDAEGEKFFGYRFVAEGVNVRFERVAADGEDVVHADQALVAGRWTHLAATFDGVRTRMIAGGQVTDERRSAIFVIGAASKLVIGSSSVNEEPFTGRIDEVAVYGREIPVDRFASHAAKVLP